VLPTTDDRQTDGLATAYSEREREFLFANYKHKNRAVVTWRAVAGASGKRSAEQKVASWRGVASEFLI